MILDSGERTKFESGAVRDIKDSVGRCDLMPIHDVGVVIGDVLLISFGHDIEDYKSGKSDLSEFLTSIAFLINKFASCEKISINDLMLEVSIHFKEGAEKYGENNWQKGIPAHSYLDSAVRHYIKHTGGYKDERHDRAFVWNLLCLMWTLRNKPECDDLRGENND